MSTHRPLCPSPSVPNHPCRIALAGAALVAALAVTTRVHAEQSGPYASRTLTLGRGTIRIDGGPPDFGYFHPASPHALNDGRGYWMNHEEQEEGLDDDWGVGLGLGVAGGITDDIEVGGLVLPMVFGPDFDIGDLEAYGRFRFLDGGFEMAFQPTLQLPSQTVFGLGLGLPMLAHLGPNVRIDTGFEIELFFPEGGDNDDDNDVSINFDIPAAFTGNLGASGFLGFRTGIYLWHNEPAEEYDGNIPIGIHGGAAIGRGGDVDLSAWFIWPEFFVTGRDDVVEPASFELGAGVSGRIR
ncbi:MAG: hypothetical protein JW751_01840 [Polyangiaceae bacterium]|nr:hypothetical protein [Polyangiaceae bacterium]